MKVIKINKKQFIGAVLLWAFVVGLYIVGIIIGGTFGGTLMGGGWGILFTLTTGMTKINREKEPFEIIEIPDEKE